MRDLPIKRMSIKCDLTKGMCIVEEGKEDS